MKLLLRTTVIRSFTALSFLLTVPACKTDCGPQDGESATSKEVQLAEFQSVSLETDCNVTISEQQGQSVTVNGYQTAINNLKLTVKNGILTIDSEKNCDHKGNPPMVTITIPVVRNLTVNGSGNIETKTPLAADEHDLNVNGSGTIKAAVNSKILRSDISGSGSLTITGNTAAATHEISGSGDLHAYDLLTAEADVEVSGSGNAEIAVNGRLDAEISGSGKVSYKGNPVLKQEVNGSGTLQQVQ
jgi:hypothetical protein